MLLGGAVSLWLFGVLSGIVDDNADSHSFFARFLPSWVENVLSLGGYVAAAFLLNSFVIIEGRTPWLGGLFVWLAACCLLSHGNLVVALSLPLFLLLLAVLMACYVRVNVQRWVYSAFSLLSAAALLLPQLLYLLPLYLLFISMTGVLTFRNIMAALLGVATPLWLLYGTAAVFLGSVTLGNEFLDALKGIFSFSFALPPLPLLLPMIIEALVVIITTMVFSRSASPAKPLMRKIMVLFICLNTYLWLLSWFLAGSAELLFFWRLPGVALFAAYIFSIKFTKFYNVLFIIFNIMWIAVALFNITIWIF